MTLSERQAIVAHRYRAQLMLHPCSGRGRQGWVWEWRSIETGKHVYGGWVCVKDRDEAKEFAIKELEVLNGHRTEKLGEDI